ncbi:MAG: hypothetical protein HYU51_16235 [Candidatus Rokubacteria bacterium]|nr:hypothetical protein [Candidatus Rokubacteria bacterium]
MDRLVFIVRRDREKLYATLKAALVTEPLVHVVVDRRQWHRRERDAPHPTERRRWDRRVRPLNEHELAERGWTVVRVPE